MDNGRGVNIFLASQCIYANGERVGTLVYDEDRDTARALDSHHRVLRTPQVSQALAKVALPKRVSVIYVSALEIEPAYRRQGLAGLALKKLSGLYRDPFLYGIVGTLGRQAPMEKSARRAVYERLGFATVDAPLGKRGGGWVTCAFWTPSMGPLGVFRGI